MEIKRVAHGVDGHVEEKTKLSQYPVTASGEDGATATKLRHKKPDWSIFPVWFLLLTLTVGAEKSPDKNVTGNKDNLQYALKDSPLSNDMLSLIWFYSYVRFKLDIFQNVNIIRKWGQAYFSITLYPVGLANVKHCSLRLTDWRPYFINWMGRLLNYSLWFRLPCDSSYPPFPVSYEREWF